MGMPIPFCEAEKLRQELPDEHLIYTNGCYDLLHPGHVEWLTECKAIGGLLVVGVTPDEVVSRKKGPNRPILLENHRLTMVTALSVVDYGFVTPASSASYPYAGMEVMDTLRPDTYVTYDKNWLQDKDWLASIGVRLEFVNDVEQRRICSTTYLIEKVLGSFGQNSPEQPKNS